MRLAFRVSYIGTRFYGSQVQAQERTVEGEFIAACRRLDLFSDFRAAGLLFAGRTDRGVHARGQVAAFTTDFPDRAIATLNTHLPPDCWCTGYAEVPDAFHPRYDAKSRTYRYYFATFPVDPDAMARAARLFTGNHNFSNFARVSDKNPHRTVHSAEIRQDGAFTYLEVTADSFLWHQVRCMATALASIGAGESDAGCIARLFEAEAERAIPPAPAEGLVLWETDCGIPFVSMDMGGRSASHLEHLRSHHALMERICTSLAPHHH
jgi:tRNA pseudouridine38-40 synthase